MALPPDFQQDRRFPQEIQVLDGAGNPIVLPSPEQESQATDPLRSGNAAGDVPLVVEGAGPELSISVEGVELQQQGSQEQGRETPSVGGLLDRIFGAGSSGEPFKRGIRTAISATVDGMIALEELAVEAMYQAGLVPTIQDVDENGLPIERLPTREEFKTHVVPHDASLKFLARQARSIDADGATGVLARPAETVLEHLDPRRIGMTINEAAPTLMGVMAASLIAPPVGIGVAGTMGAGSTREELARIEMTSDSKLSPSAKAIAPIAVGALNAALERTGADKVLRSVGAKGVREKILKALVAGFTEGVTESAQEAIQISGVEITKIISDEAGNEFDVQEGIGTRIAGAFYSGLVTGTAVSGGTQGLAGLGADQSAGILLDPSSSLDDIRFTVDRPGHEFHGQNVSLEQIQADPVLEVPVFRKQFFRSMARRQGLNESTTNIAEGLVRSLAYSEGLPIERYLGEAVLKTDDPPGVSGVTRRASEPDVHVIFRQAQKLQESYNSRKDRTTADRSLQVFREYLNGNDSDALKKHFRVGRKGWTEGKNNRMSKDFIRWVDNGRASKHPMSEVYGKLEAQMLHSYATTIAATPNVDTSPGARSFYNKLADGSIFNIPVAKIAQLSRAGVGKFNRKGIALIDSDIPDLPDADNPRELRKFMARDRSWWDKFVDVFDIEGRYQRAGMRETGLRIKTFESEREMHTQRAEDLVGRVSKILGSDQEMIAEAILVSESMSRMTDPSTPTELVEAATLIRRYFDEYREVFKSFGALDKGFAERLVAQAQRKLTAAEESADATEADIAALQEQLDQAADVAFVHIPITAWFSRDAQKDPSRAGLALNIIRQRENPTIQGLIDAGVIEKSALNLPDILASYSRRVGRDLALLRIRDAGIREGAIVLGDRLRQPGLMVDRSPGSVFKGHQLSPMLADWVDTMQNRSRPVSIFRKALRGSKVFQFIDPFFLPIYNVYQFAMGGGINANLGQNIRDAWNDVQERTPEYYEAQLNGLAAKPFATPFEDVHNRLLAAQYDGDFFGAAAVGKVQQALRKTFEFGFTKGYEGDSRVGRVARQVADVMTMPARAIREIYRLSAETAWFLDGFERQITLRDGLQRGLSPEKAAQRAALIHGDYASLPAGTRIAANTIFFTPTFKVAMAKFFTDSVRGFGSILAGTATTDARTRAGVIVRSLGIMVAMDAMMTVLGFEREQFGRKYVRPIRFGGKGEEAVMTFSGPHNLFLKYLQRVQEATDVTVTEPLDRFVRSIQWEFNPLIRELSRIRENRDPVTGDKIWFVLDDPANTAFNITKYIIPRIFTIFSQLNETPLDRRSQEVFREEFGRFFTVVSGRFAFQSLRSNEGLRLARAIESNVQLLEEELGLSGLATDFLRGMTVEEFNQKFPEADRNRRIQKALERLEVIQSRFNDDYYSIERPLQTAPSGGGPIDIEVLDPTAPPSSPDDIPIFNE